MSIRKSISVLFLFLSCLFILWFSCTDPTKPEFGTEAKLTNKQIQTHGNPVVDSLFLLYVSVEGAPPFQYHWYKNSVEIPSAIDSILSFDALLDSNAGNYKCIVENDYGSDTSNVYSLNVFTLPSITTPDKKIQTSSPVPELDSSFYLYITATGSETLKYQWNYNGVSKSIDKDTLVIDSFQAADTGIYQCIVTNDYGTDSSKVCTLSLSQNKPPVVSDIPGQTIQKGGAFSVINLDDYVADPDNADSQIVWTASATTNITVTISTDRKATITANSSDWTGSETVKFTAQDPDNLSDTNSAVFRISEGSLPPVVSDIPDQAIKKGGVFSVINLDDYVADPDNTDDEITWTASATKNITVTISTDRKATITANSADWVGSETVTFTALDLDSLSDTDSAVFTISEASLAPVVSDIPNQTVKKGSPFTVVNLDDYVADPDNTDDQLTWTASATTNITVTISTDREATITANSADWTGSETVKFTSKDPDDLFDTCRTTFTVTDNDPPVVSDIPDETIAEGDSFTVVNLDDYVTDADNTDDQITWTASTTTNLTVTIDTNRQATIIVVDPDWNGSEAVTFTATDPTSLSNSDNATFEVTAVNDPPVLSDIPDQTISEGGSFTAIELDEFVADVDNSDDEIAWTASATTNITVTINASRQATIVVVDSEWNGSETVLFTAKDPGDLADTNYATFTVIAEGDPPIVSNIPDQTIAEGGSFTVINLDDFVTDADNSVDEITWTASATTNITVSINTTNRQATITVVNPEWNGSEDVTFTATDPTTLSNSDNVTFEVTAVNDPPVLSDIPNQTIAEGGSFTAIELDEFVADVDNSDDEITWTASATTNITVTINASRQATIVVVDSEWNGSETVLFTAKDPAELADTNYATFTVTVDEDPPIVSNIPDQTIAEGGSFTVIDLDDYVTDNDNSVDEITWTASATTNITVSINTTTRQATITVVDAEWNGSEEVTFTATDPTTLSNSANVTFEVTPVNDPPVITAQTTLTINEDESQILSISHLTIDDPDNTTFTGPVLNNGANYTFTGNTVTPSADYHGTLTVPVTVGDGTNYSAPFDVTITVNSVNDAPSFNVPTDVVVDEDEGAVTIPNFATSINRGATNESSQTIAFHISDVSPNFSVQPQISSNGTLTFSTKPDVYCDPVVFNVHCTDDGGTLNGGEDTSPIKQFMIEVESVNDNPVISTFNVPSSVDYGSPITISCTFSDVEEKMSKLELYFDGSLVVTRTLTATQTSDNFPWTPTYSSSIIGSHDVNIKVYDSNGGSATSSNDVCSVAGTSLSDQLSVEALLDANGISKTFAQCIADGHVNILSGETRVSALSFYANQISEIPPEIGNMDHLKALGFIGSNLSSLPSELSRCTLIEQIIFQNNSFTSIPSVVYTWSNLTVMYIINSTTLSGPVSPSIGNLTKLQNVYLNSTNITSLPAEIKNCPVTTLDVNNTPLTTFPAGLGVWRDMLWFNFNSCNVTTLPTDIVTVGANHDPLDWTLDAGNNPELVANATGDVRDWLDDNDPDWDE